MLTNTPLPVQGIKWQSGLSEHTFPNIILAAWQLLLSITKNLKTRNTRWWESLSSVSNNDQLIFSLAPWLSSPFLPPPNPLPRPIARYNYCLWPAYAAASPRAHRQLLPPRPGRGSPPLGVGAAAPRRHSPHPPCWAVLTFHHVPAWPGATTNVPLDMNVAHHVQLWVRHSEAHNYNMILTLGSTVASTRPRQQASIQTRPKTRFAPHFYWMPHEYLILTWLHLLWLSKETWIVLWNVTLLFYCIILHN